MKIVVDSKIPFANEAFGTLGDVVTIETKGITRSAVADADALIVRSETHVHQALLGGSRVQFVGTATIGFDHVDVGFLQQQGLAFASAPGCNANSVAEYVVAALLDLAGRFDFELRGKTLGVVGVGNVGSKVVRYAEAMGMTVLQNDPPLARTTGDARFLSLDELMDADIVTLHVPLTKVGEDATFHLFEEKRLQALRAGSILINTSRGGVVHTGAAKAALRQRHLRAAVFDVWEGEPHIDVELLGLAALGTPHIAGYSFDGKVNGTIMVYEALCAHLGVSPSWTVPGNLPVADAPVLTSPTGYTNIESALRQLISRCYNIEHDDAGLRAMVAISEEERGDYFRRLRAQYPPRHEFFNFSVKLDVREQKLASVLMSLGFRIIEV